MQITINTSDILGDETTIRDEVIDQVAKALLHGMRRTAQDAMKEAINNGIATAVKEAVDQAVSMHLDTEFVLTDEYGRRKQAPTTVRALIADHLQQQCIFKTGSYSDKNAFTKAVQDVADREMSKFKKEFNSLVTKQVVEQSMDMAVKKLREALGIKV